MTTLEPDFVFTERKVDLRVLWAVGAAAVAFDLAVRSGVATFGGALLVAVTALGLAMEGGLRNPQARALAALAPVFGAFLSLRSADWLMAFDIAAVAAVLVSAASFAGGGSVLDIRMAALAQRLLHAFVGFLRAPRFVASALPARRAGSAAPLVRGLVLAVPVVFVLGTLLASGDAVFASVFRVSLDPSSWFAHVLLAGMGAWGMAGLLATAASEPPADQPSPAPRLGRVEATVVLASVVALYAAFVGTQAVAASKGAQWVQERAGLTYAEYARSGFFQLLGVAVLTLLTLAAVRACTAADRRLTGLALATVALTLVVVGMAVRRLHLYEQAFGLTVLRLLAIVVAVWLGAVFVLLAASWVGVGRGRSWLPAGAASVGLALLLVLNVVDPEALVVRRNLSRPDFDIGYATTLSDDAVPALVRRMPEARAFVCAGRVGNDGWAGWNRSARRAEAACAATDEALSSGAAR